MPVWIDQKRDGLVCFRIQLFKLSVLKYQSSWVGLSCVEQKVFGITILERMAIGTIIITYGVFIDGAFLETFQVPLLEPHLIPELVIRWNEPVCNVFVDRFLCYINIKRCESTPFPF